MAKELGVPYKIEAIDYTVLHEKPFVDINPNGRAPGMALGQAQADPNS